MKLNKGDRIEYNNFEYEVVAVVWSTAYLREAEKSGAPCCHMDAVRETYKNIEFLKVRN